MPQLTKDQWLEVRDKWENDPKLSYGALAVEYNVSKQVIHARSKRDEWVQRGDLASITRAANRRADALTDPGKADTPIDEPTDAGTDVKVTTDETPQLKKEVGLDEAIDKRTDVLVKHRNEILMLDKMQAEVVRLFATAKNTKIKDDWWQAKIAADCVRDHVAISKMKQEIERKSWGMDEINIDMSKLSDEQLEDIINGKLPR
jgi:hypothetical protein